MATKTDSPISLGDAKGSASAFQSQARFGLLLVPGIRWVTLRKCAYFAGDLLALMLACVVAGALGQYHAQTAVTYSNSLYSYRVYVPFFLIVLYAFGSYNRLESQRPEQGLTML